VENVDRHRRIIEAFNARDIDRFIAYCDPSMELHSVMTVPGGADYVGHDGLRQWVTDLADAWGDNFRIEPEAFFDLGEQTLAWQALVGRGRQSGADVAEPTAAAITWRAGLAVTATNYRHRHEALRDLGLSEEALQPIRP
jgi:hypothetical protein